MKASSSAGSISWGCSGTSRCSAYSRRLYYRDGKSGYLKDLPRVLAYTQAAARRYPETAQFAEYIESHIAPRFDAAQARAAARGVPRPA